MKRLLLTAAILIGIQTIAYAETLSEETAAAVATTERMLCEARAALAGTLMGLRQLGASKSTLTNFIENSKNASGDNKDYIFFIIDLAFDVPVYDTELGRSDAASEFSRKIVLFCLDS